MIIGKKVNRLFVQPSYRSLRPRTRDCRRTAIPFSLILVEHQTEKVSSSVRLRLASLIRAPISPTTRALANTFEKQGFRQWKTRRRTYSSSSVKRVFPASERSVIHSRSHSEILCEIRGCLHPALSSVDALVTLFTKRRLPSEQHRVYPSMAPTQTHPLVPSPVKSTPTSCLGNATLGMQAKMTLDTPEEERLRGSSGERPDPLQSPPAQTHREHQNNGSKIDVAVGRDGVFTDCRQRCFVGGALPARSLAQSAALGKFFVKVTLSMCSMLKALFRAWRRRREKHIQLLYTH